MNAAPGLVTMKDWPVLSAAVEDMRKYVTALQNHTNSCPYYLATTNS